MVELPDPHEVAKHILFTRVEDVEWSTIGEMASDALDESNDVEIPDDFWMSPVYDQYIRDVDEALCSAVVTIEWN